MEKQNQTTKILQLIKQNKPHKFFHEVNEVDKGIGFVLGYLEEHNGVGYANSIAEEANISRARVAVLINKLERKGFILKESSLTDARIVLLKLTQLGMEHIQEIKKNIEKRISKVIKVVGYEKVLQFAQTATEISNVLYNEE